jgi:hypothetical protein
MHDNIKKKIDIIRNASKLNKAYLPMIEAYDKEEMSLSDLLIAYVGVKMNNDRKGFKSLIELRDESTRFAKERETTKEGRTTIV